MCMCMCIYSMYISLILGTGYWVIVFKESTPRKERYLWWSYVFIEHFMAFNINTTRKMHKSHITTTLDSIHPNQPSLEKKNAPPFSLRSLGPDSNACSLITVNQTFCISRRRHGRSESVMKTVNSIIAYVTNYVICAYPARTWLNFASIFTDQSSAREIILTVALSTRGNEFRCVV